MISVDNVSETGAGRLVLSYDAGDTAYVWDIFTGNEITKFHAYDPIRVAAWMKNGNVAFGRIRISDWRKPGTDVGLAGNPQGTVVIFTPSHGEHKSTRTIYVPITALAPAWDFQSYAIGFVFLTISLAHG